MTYVRLEEVYAHMSARNLSMMYRDQTGWLKRVLPPPGKMGTYAYEWILLLRSTTPLQEYSHGALFRHICISFQDVFLQTGS